METDWAENRAKVPQDFIRNALGKVLDSLYSTGERDKFRTRLEPAAGGGTEIYITHRGLTEVYSTQMRDSTVWTSRPSDPELEAEFLRRMLVKLGADQIRASTQVAAASPPAAGGQAGAAAPAGTERARVVGSGPSQQLEVRESFDRAWRRVGLALDRGGFTVEDRDRSQGVYYVRYIDPEVEAKGSGQPGLFARLFKFGDKRPTSAQQYRVKLAGQGEVTQVSVLLKDGQPVSSDQDRQTHAKILTLLREQLAI
jgi:outer membrane protein assembly factor BamC